MRGILALVVVLALALALGVGVGAAAHDEPDRDEILGIELDPGGDATVYYIESYNLSNESERAEFEAFEDNETLRQQHRDDVVAGLEDAAAGGRERTDLDMRVEDPAIETYEQDGHGRVAVSVQWRNLAFADEERVVVTEPFAGGYAPDVNRVAIHGPPEYRRGTTQPDPARARANSSLWNPETADLSEMHMEFTAPGAGDDGSGDGAEDGSGGDGLDTDAVVTFVWALLLAIVPLAVVFYFLRRGRA